VSGDQRGRRPRAGSEAGIGADPYATLGLPTGAPMSDVKRAYRRLAKAFHPDSAGAEALPRFLAIHEAYERIATGRILPGSTSPPASAPRREPWRADPARARATRQRAASGGAARRAGTEPGAAPRSDDSTASDDRGRRGRTSSGRRTATRKATLGSTSYDDARDRADATWSGASWYGPSTGEYWIINPREYADPRKHGPAYQARIRQAAAEAAASAETASGQAAPADVVFDEAESPPAPARPASPPRAGRPSHAPSPSPRAEPAVSPPITGERRPRHRVEASASGPATQAQQLRWPPPGDAAVDPLRRVRLAIVAWPPLGVAAAISAADVTGCAMASASCDGLDPFLPWLAQPVILALLALLPPLARFLSFGTIGVLVAIVPVTAVLLAFGAGGTPQAGFALGALLALAWLGGLAYAAVSGLRRASPSTPR
jgi:DnaJ domain